MAGGDVGATVIGGGVFPGVEAKGTGVPVALAAGGSDRGSYAIPTASLQAAELVRAANTMVRPRDRIAHSLSSNRNPSAARSLPSVPVHGARHRACENKVAFRDHQ